MAIRVLQADDHKIFREGVKTLLAQEQEISIIAETSDGARAVELALSLRPDVVILDINMPQLNGIEAARRIAAQAPELGVIMLSMHTEKVYVLEALRAGARGFLAKTCSSSELADAIRRVAAGEPYLSSTISSATLGLISLPPAQPAPQASKERLSRRENEVLRLMANRDCTKEIASRLDISCKTVETYRSALMKKLNLGSVAELVKYALREGIIELS